MVLAKNEKTKKTKKFYECKNCHYVTCKITDYDRHLKTNKHVSNVTKSVSKKFVFCAKNEKKNIKKCVCGREFKTRGGLWKHKKKCDDVGDHEMFPNVSKKNEMFPCVSKKTKKKISRNSTKKKVVETSAFFSAEHSVELKLKEMEIENMRLQNQILKHQLENDAMKAINKLADKVGDTNCHNTQNININMYLNDKCKNAMNLEDFVDKIKLTLQDLNYAGGNGLTKSINNVFVKSLGDLEPDERPIHCSDKQKKVFYVKENDEWAKDENNIHIDQTIHNIHMGHLDALARWDKDHPNWINDEYLTKEREKYSAVWGPIDEKDKKNEKDLIKECLCETVDLNNDLMSNL
jgi:hypothetical protein